MEILTCERCKTKFQSPKNQACPVCTAKVAGWEVVDNFYVNKISCCVQSLYIIRKGWEIFLVEGFEPDLHEIATFHKCTQQEQIDLLGMNSLHIIRGGAVCDLIERIQNDIKNQ